MRSALALALALSAACEAPEPAEAPNRVNGLIVAIDRDDAGEIRAFTVEARDEQRHEISIGIDGITGSISSTSRSTARRRSRS